MDCGKGFMAAGLRSLAVEGKDRLSVTEKQKKMLEVSLAEAGPNNIKTHRQWRS